MLGSNWTKINNLKIVNKFVIYKFLPYLQCSWFTERDFGNSQVKVNLSNLPHYSEWSMQDLQSKSCMFEASGQIVPDAKPQKGPNYDKSLPIQTRLVKSMKVWFSYKLIKLFNFKSHYGC